MKKMLILLILLFATTASSETVDPSKQYWVFFPSEMVTVYEKPSMDSPIFGQWGKPLLLTETRRADGWIHIFKDGQSYGYIQRRGKGELEYITAAEYMEREKTFTVDPKEIAAREEARAKEEADRIKEEEARAKEAEKWLENNKKEQAEKERKARNEKISKVVGGIVILVLLAIFFFIPSIVGKNKRNSTAIGFLNGSLLFLFIGGAVAVYFLLAPLFQGIAFFGLCGFSLISWIFTLVWALCKD